MKPHDDPRSAPCSLPALMEGVPDCAQLQPGSEHLGDYQSTGRGRVSWGPGAGDRKGAGRALGDLTDSLGWMQGAPRRPPGGGAIPHSPQEM